MFAALILPPSKLRIKGESYRLKGRKEFMRQKQQTVNTLLVQGSTWFLLPPQKNDKISSAFSYNFKSALTADFRII